jgi:hypothetical protein
MMNYRTIREVEEEYLRNHLDKIDDYFTVLFDDYAESGDTVSLSIPKQSHQRSVVSQTSLKEKPKPDRFRKADATRTSLNIQA